MQHKDDSAGRWAALIAVVVVALNIYWAVSAFLRPVQLNLALVAVGLLLQVGGISLGLGKGPNAARRRTSGALFLVAILFGSSIEWLGLFHSTDATHGRVSPSIWSWPK